MNAKDYIDYIFDSFIELHGDRSFGDDIGILCGIAKLNNKSVAVIGQMSGDNINENIKYNFSMTLPHGFRKAIKLIKLANKLNLPVIMFVDTIGADPTQNSEEHGQAYLIAECIKQSLICKSLTISVCINDGNSGGALAFATSNYIISMNNAKINVISNNAATEIIKNKQLSFDDSEIYDKYIDDECQEKSIKILKKTLILLLKSHNNNWFILKHRNKKLKKIWK
mgnify:CR=1 FL=1